MTPAELLEFERHPWLHAGPKEQAIRDRFGLTPTRYYQALVGVLQDPASLAIDAQTVRRLQRAMTSRRRVG